ncbi:pyridoxamine 5'-phosphate oxidase [Williamsia sterculiae]|nr:pyridoxamine 5'-phosphate oxidase [Williamsia sterculiae]
MRVGYGAGIPPNVGVGDRAAGADGVRDNLDPSWLHGDPPWLDLFNLWLREGIEARIPEPNAMVVATVDADGMPSTRTVLCKGADRSGIVFYTGYDSDKAHHLDANPVASVTFPWIALERQVHFRGRVHKVDRAETEHYWQRRPRGSQLGAVASDQSKPIDSRIDLERKAAEAAQRFGDDPIPAPDDWGGFRLVPDSVEFWQGRANRLHNRALATLVDGRWQVTRLQP